MVKNPCRSLFRWANCSRPRENRVAIIDFAIGLFFVSFVDNTEHPYSIKLDVVVRNVWLLLTRIPSNFESDDGFPNIGSELCKISAIVFLTEERFSNSPILIELSGRQIQFDFDSHFSIKLVVVHELLETTEVDAASAKGRSIRIVVPVDEHFVSVKKRMKDRALSRTVASK